MNIHNATSNTLVNGTNKNDSIYNDFHGYKVSIYSGKGNDIVLNSGEDCKIKCGDGKDSVYNHAKNCTINGENDSDYIWNKGGSDGCTLIGGEGNDSIENYESKDCKIECGRGNDSILNLLSENCIINGGDGRDTIENYESKNCIINGGAGDDYIPSGNGPNDFCTISGGEGNDSIKNSGKNVVISGGTGNDSINYMGNDSTIIGGVGSDSIINYSDYCKIACGAGDDSVDSIGDNVTISGDSGNNSLGSYGKYVIVNGGTGNDSIDSYGEYVIVNGGTGNDSIRHSGSDATISGGQGKDSIRGSVRAKNTIIFGGSGDDFICATGSNVTISGENGNDQISLTGREQLWKASWGTYYDTLYADNAVVKYAQGDGKDTIYGFDSDDKIKITSGNINNAKLKGNDVIITVSKGSITLKDSKDKEITVVDSKGKEIKFKNTYKGVETSTLPSGVTYNKAKTALTVKAPFSGEINLVNYDSNVVTVDASRDTKFVTIKGNAKNNVIKAGTGGSSLYGQGGDDSLYGGSGVDTFYYGDSQGNDVIVNYTVGKDKIKLTSGSIKSSSLSGKDVILNIGNGSIKVKNAVGKEITVIDSKGKSSTKVYGSTTRPNQKSQQQVIKDFMAVLDTTTSKGAAAIDSAFKLASGSRYKSMQDVIDNFLSDLGKTDSDTFLHNCCGIVLENEDTGAITGLDTGGSTSAKTNNSVIPENGKFVNLVKKYNSNTLNDLPDVDYDSKTGTLKFTKRGLTLTIKNYDKIILDSQNESIEGSRAQEKLVIINGLYSWWIEEAIRINEESYGNNFKFNKTATVTNMNLKFVYDESSGSHASVNANLSDKFGKEFKKPLDLSINMFWFIGLNDSNVDGEIDNTYLDQIIAHEFTHAIMYSHVNYMLKLPVLIREGVAELTRGIDNDTGFGRRKDMIDLIKEYKNTSFDKLNKTNLAVILSNKKNSYKDTYLDGYLNTYQYSVGYMLLRYFARQMSINSGLPDGLSYSGDQKTLNVQSPYKGIIDLKDYASYSPNSTKNNTINVDASHDKNALTIIGNDKANIIKTGTGGSSLYGQRGNDTLFGGSGKDTFFYADGDGNDKIVNYTAGKDKIKLTSGSIKSSKVNRTDVILNIGNGSIKIKNGAGKKITVIDSNDNETTRVYGVSRKVSSLWFADDTNLSTSSAQIDSI